MRRAGWLGAALVALTALGDGAPPAIDREGACRANNRGVALLEQFKPEQAAPAFRAALASDPGLGLARVNLALALLLSDDLPGAEKDCLLYTSPSPRDRTRSRMPSSA